MFGNTHVKAGVRIAAVTLGIAAGGLLGAPIASAALALPVQATAHVDGTDPLLGSVGVVANTELDADVAVNANVGLTLKLGLGLGLDLDTLSLASTGVALTGK